MQGISGPWYNILMKITGKLVYPAFALNAPKAQPAVPTRVTPSHEEAPSAPSQVRRRVATKTRAWPVLSICSQKERHHGKDN